MLGKSGRGLGNTPPISGLIGFGGATSSSSPPNRLDHSPNRTSIFSS
ncbi:MAG: hypothetical protein IT212_13340 [Bacteroidia bacterium]|nr:hypothetical protein [Bacteroidia bacterium]